MGISDPAKLLDDDPAAAAFQPRPEGLGLGAKFLAHHKARNAGVCFVTFTTAHPCLTITHRVQQAILCAGSSFDHAVGEAFWEAFAACIRTG